MTNLTRRALLSASAAAPAALFLNQASAKPSAAAEGHPEPAGLQFVGTQGALEVVRRDMARLLEELHIRRSHVQVDDKAVQGRLTLSLTTPSEDTDTLSFFRRPEFWMQNAPVEMPLSNGRKHTVSTVSPKEIVLSLLQHGRLTVFSGSECSVAALMEHVRLRQHIVAWAQDLSWGWPDGGSAYWNKRLWNRGTPWTRDSTHAALLDTLVNQPAYGIGCYTAAKMVYAGAVLDFYVRVAPDAAKARRVLNRLWSDGDPLVGMEPGAMWSFEPGHTAEEEARPGKLLGLVHGVAPRNFVPGDWTYFWNTDPVTYEKTGYEGSNAVYLGQGKFSDYYNDNEHSFTYEQKLDDVYQWRHGVFSRRRDFEKAVLLSPADLERLSKTPNEGGLLLPLRAGPLNANQL